MPNYAWAACLIPNNSSHLTLKTQLRRSIHSKYIDRLILILSLQSIHLDISLLNNELHSLEMLKRQGTMNYILGSSFSSSKVTNFMWKVQVLIRVQLAPRMFFPSFFPFKGRRKTYNPFNRCVEFLSNKNITTYMLCKHYTS